MLALVILIGLGIACWLTWLTHARNQQKAEIKRQKLLRESVEHKLSKLTNKLYGRKEKKGQ